MEHVWVHKGRWNETDVSVKIVNTTTEEQKMIKEVAILRQVSPKYIVSIMAVSHEKYYVYHGCFAFRVQYNYGIRRWFQLHNIPAAGKVDLNDKY